MPAGVALNTLAREGLEGRIREELRSANSHRPRLVLVETPEGLAVVKDYRPCGWLLRAIFGPWLSRREEFIYRTLAGGPGIPRLFGRVDRHALAVEYVAGRNAQEFAGGTLPPEFFTRLQEAVDAMHARGVVHCDLKNRRNVVVAEGYRPYLVDFSTAFIRGSRLNLARRFLFARFVVDDRKAVVKARLQVGRLWDPDDAAFAYHRGPLERAVRWVRDGLRGAFELLSGRNRT
jgi:hypothetical protein